MKRNAILKQQEVRLIHNDHSEAQQKHWWLDRNHYPDRTLIRYVNFVLASTGVMNVGGIQHQKKGSRK